MAITKLKYDLLLTYLLNLPHKAILSINGVDIDFEISKSIKEENAVVHYIFVEDEIGIIKEAHLVDNLGRRLDSYEIEIEKGYDGFNIKFKDILEVKGELIANG